MAIASTLLRRLYSKLLQPVIIEFTSLEAMKSAIPDLKQYIDVNQLTPLHPPATLKEILSARDRIISRFQNPLASFKVLEHFKMVAMPLFPRDIEEIAAWPEVAKIYPDRIMSILQYPTVPPEAQYTSPTGQKFTTVTHTKKLLEADIANKEGYNGEGIIVAVPDTGGSPSHEMTRQMEYYSTMREKGQIKDTNGHGEWCVSTIGGREWFDRTLMVKVEGVAPKCHLIGIKCLGFIVGFGFDSDVLEAIQLAIERGAHIVSMSLGSEEVPADPSEDPQIKAVDTMVENGIIPVIAAGNSGPSPGSINSPGCADSALTVGAYDPFTGLVADFSSRGPTPWGTIKPDVVAPGVNIYSGCLGVLDPVGDGLYNHFSVLSGTSMATPHVAGLLACAKQYYESLGVNLTVDLVKTICETYGEPKNNDSGWGILTWSMFKRYAAEHLA
ncbi:MAG: S8 family serine peptidase [Nitrososphaerota archaeon]